MDDLIPFSTDRLIIRKATLEDVDLMLKMDKQEDTQKYLGGIKNKTKEERIELIKKKKDMLTVCLKDNTPIGFIGLKVLDNNGELSYIFDSDYWKNGYCYESCKELINIGFNKLNLDYIYAETIKDNSYSSKVLLKLGFELGETYERDNNTFNFYIIRRI